MSTHLLFLYLLRKQASKLLWVLSIFLHLPATAQIVNRLSAGTPPPPEAAALGKFAETPVSLFTGVPDISIPIYEVKLRGVTLPISLNYHASGVRVTEVASSVGLSWALQAGGSISSTVMGLDDFRGSATGAGYTNTYRIPTDRRLVPIYPETDYSFCMYATATPNAYQNTVLAGFDTQPDLFYYNFCGRSGKFFYTQDRQPHTMPYTPIVIQRGTERYTITDEAGNKYLYTALEESYTYITRSGGRSSPQDDYKPRSTAYYLTAVETPYHESITLTYDTLTYHYQNLGSYTRYKTFATEANGLNQGCFDKEPTSTTSITKVRSLQLATIRSSRGDFVEFDYSTCKRLDLANAEALKRITVHQGSTTRTFNLGYGYFNLPQSTSDCDHSGFQGLRDDHRLKLTSVTEVGKPSYVITYHEEVAMPSRLSTAQDHWGYFNNWDGGLLPAEPSKGFIEGGRREPDAAAMKVGIIKSLQYPTGGRTTYEFEPNDFYSPPGTIAYDTLVHAVSFISTPDDDHIPLPSEVVIQEVSFTVPANVQLYSMQARYRTGCGVGENQITPQFRLNLTGPNGFTKTFASFVNADREETLNLAPGTYHMTATTVGNCPANYFYLQWMEHKSRSTPGSNVLAGGLRIREVRDTPQPGAEPLRRRYRYALPTDSLRSSGRTLHVPQYSYEITQYNRDPAAPDRISTVCRYQAQSSNSVQSLGGVQGASAGYPYVQVYRDRRGEQGMSAHTFSWEDDLQYFVGYPFTPPTSMDWQRGLPLEIIDYSYNNATGKYQPLRKTRNRYHHNYTPPTNYSCEDCANYTVPTQPNESHAIGLNIILQRPETIVKPIGWGPSTVSPAQFLIESFKYTSVWSYLTEKDEYSYSPSDSTSYHLVKTFYKYDNPTHAQLTRTQTLTSAGDTMTTRQLYALDYDTANAASAVALGLKSLARRHILTDIVEQQQWLKKQGASYLLGGKLAQYRGTLPSQDFALQAASPIPASQFTSSAIRNGSFLQDRRYRPTLAYELFDGLGNILQARQFQAGPQSFLWGYSATQPVARAQNAEYNQLAYTSFEAGCPSRWRHPSLYVTAGGHTGQQCYQLLSPVSCDSLPAGKYQLSFWATASPDITQNGQLLPIVVQPIGPTDPNGFRQYTGTLQLSATRNQVTLSSNQALRLDELRLHPAEAQLTTYTHDPLTGITSQTDVNGRTASYEYDALGRLQRIRDEQGNILTQQEYHYARP
ncbi:RHS repeat protein [Hymenobacter cellulosivorans]|uniref:RHS repeat protein n=1 Tax=Hymenobacter cellulosivorans TaxID=2932249 RepID=A0ABY4FCE8_9BACT|nr:RHS repeat domain-containing protein [Hymenobacter cellulosivorans]UOQ54229.1 RHS repeat protein [Hymenobacter cellulosivorans]